MSGGKVIAAGGLHLGVLVRIQGGQGTEGAQGEVDCVITAGGLHFGAI